MENAKAPAKGAQLKARLIPLGSNLRHTRELRSNAPVPPLECRQDCCLGGHYTTMFSKKTIVHGSRMFPACSTVRRNAQHGICHTQTYFWNSSQSCHSQRSNCMATWIKRYNTRECSRITTTQNCLMIGMMFCWTKQKSHKEAHSSMLFRRTTSASS